MNSLILLPLVLASVAASPLLPVFPYQQAAVPVVLKTTSYSAASQYHAQDKIGGYDYGYANSLGAKKETKHADGTVTGTYTHPLPDGRLLTNNYVADEYGFRSSLAPTAAKDFAPKVKAHYEVQAPLVQTTVDTVAVHRPPLKLTKSVDYVAPAVAAPFYYAAAPAYYSYDHVAAPAYSHYYYY